MSKLEDKLKPRNALSLDTKLGLKIVAKPYIKAAEQIGEIFFPQAKAIKEIMCEVYSAQKQLCFHEYLEGIAYYLDRNSIDEDHMTKLIEEIRNSQNYETMMGILDSVFFSRSQLCRTILGIITGKYLQNELLDYEDMVLVVALKDLFDDDIETFWRCYKVRPTSPADHTSFLNNYSSTERMCVEKLQNCGVLGRDLVPARLGGDPRSVEPLRFELTSTSDRLQRYLEVIRPYVIKDFGEGVKKCHTCGEQMEDV